MKRIILSAFALLSFGLTAQTHFSADFAAGLTGWTSIDNDSDPAPASGTNYDEWYAADFSSSFAGIGAMTAVSRSWAANVAYTPDNLLVSPAINLTGVSGTGLTLLFTTGTIEATPYHAEHYSVYVTTASDLGTITSSTPVFTETLSTPSAISAHSVNLSAYAGQTVYITFRHHNTFDMNTLLLDNVMVKTLAPNDAGLVDVILARYAAIGTNNVLAAEVKNEGSSAITSLQLNWNDGTDHIATINTNIAPGATAVVNHPTAISAATAVEKNLTVTIGQVNNSTDADLSNNGGSALFNTVSQIAQKAVVIEEGTGTWCGWCPRGAVAMEHMYDIVNDNTFIGIAVHNGDPMTVAAYNTGAAISGFPGCNVDRAVLDASVSQPAFESYYNDRKDLVAPAGIAVTSSLAGANATINVSSTFYTPFASANYRLGVIIVEDGVTGTGSGYNQVNYYAGGGNGAMGGYEILPDPVPAAQMVYDHVGRALLGGYTGQTGSVPTTITDGQVVNYTFNYTVPATSDATKMVAVAVLIDQVSGEIVNARKIRLSGSAAGVAEGTNMDLNVFPNPAKDVVNVAFEAKATSYNVQIIDMQGRIVFEQSFSNLSGAQNLAIPMNNVEPGNYLITLSTAGESFTKVLTVE